MRVLFLFESVLPVKFHRQTASPGELRVIAAQQAVTKVVALGRKGVSFYDPPSESVVKTELEKKILIERFTWPGNLIGYYFSWIGLLWYGFSLCRKYRFSVIHAESPHVSGIAAIVLGKLFGIKVIVEYRVSYENLIQFRYKQPIRYYLNSIFTWVCRFVFKNAWGVAANSRTYMHELKARYTLKNVFHYAPGCILPSFNPRFRKKVRTIGFLGRMYSEKGGMDFLKMIFLGQEWFRSNGITFLMAGDGPQHSDFVQYITKKQITDLVSLVGTVERWSFLKKIDILINTTLVASALEMVIVEAASFGISVVAYGNDGYPETVDHGKTGIIVTTGSVQDLLSSVKFLVTNRPVYESMRDQAIIFSKKYSFASQVEQVKNMYHRLYV